MDLTIVPQECLGYEIVNSHKQVALSLTFNYPEQNDCLTHSISFDIAVKTYKINFQTEKRVCLNH